MAQTEAQKGRGLMGYEQIKDAAQRRAEGESTGAWKLADALVAEIPEREHGKAITAGNGSDVATIMADIAAELIEAEIETPAGAAYTVASLRELRLVALGWPQGERMLQAAFRTHQETGSSDLWKRGVLRALCDAARTEDYSYPETSAIDEGAWAKAIVGVQRKIKAGNRYPVSANDLRVALKRKANVPPRDRTPGTTVMDAIEELQIAGEHAKQAAKILSSEGISVGDCREALEGLRDTLRHVVEWVDVLLSGGGITDDALTALLDGEQLS
jgi:hypothetical protein